MVRMISGRTVKTTRLVLDLDGVLFDFNSGWAKLAEELHGKSVTDSPDDWDEAHDCLTPAERRQMWANIVNPGSTFWRDLPTYEWTRPFLNELATLPPELEVYFLTSRSGFHCKFQTEQALEAAGYPSPPVLTVRDAKLKLPILDALGAHRFVDDKPETVNAAFTQLKKLKTYGFSQPWNKKKFSRGVVELKDIYGCLEGL